MKNLITILTLFCCITLNAQVAIVPKIGSALPHNLTGFVGVELQGSMVSVEFSWRPYSIDHNMYSDGVGLGLNLYLFPYENTPYSSIKIITKGKAVIDEYTGSPERSLTALIGYRWYPFKPGKCDVIKRFSLNLGAGIDICNHKDNLTGITRARIKFAAELSVNFILFKFDNNTTSKGPLSYRRI
jgi:hypothetical protein